MIRHLFLLIFLLIPFFNYSYGQQKNHLKRAISAMEIGLFDESLKQLNQALIADPKNAQIHKLKALIYEALNDNKNAITSWNECIQHSKDQNTTNEAKVHLDNLNGF